jgi:cytochrome c oxidase subunit 1
LTLFHLWVAFAAFAVAAVLGVWQMWARSPLPAPFLTAQAYFTSVTAHGVSMAYVLTTFMVMGFGYYVAETSLGRPLPLPGLAWLGFALGILGSLMAAATIFAGQATVLFTFYPPLTASPYFYIGLVLVVVGSWIWCGLMILAMLQYKRANPGVPVPLAMFATVANAVMWLWTTVGVAAELLFQVIPAAFGWNEAIDVGLSRTLFSWTLHAIVYFWLIPAYIAFYTMAPQEAGGRLYSDTMGRLTFILFLIYSLPVGMHHLFMDPQQSSAFKFLQMSFTALVAAPTLLTVFTITASLEIAGRLRGGRGLFGWIGALPWDRPMVLATGMAFFMLWFGGGGGLVNMSFGMNAMVHNTSWVTAHFHLIFGGTVVIMYFAIAYAIWPMLTDRRPVSLRLQRVQLWLWFIGMMVMTLPWHYLGLQGQWRRVATFNYADPNIAGWGPWVIVSFAGGAVLLASALLFVWNLLEFHRARAVAAAGLRPLYAVAVHPPERVPAALNGFALWNVLVLVLMVAAYGYPVAQFFIINPPEAIVHRVDGRG